jgi:hypothetical protein
MDDVTIIKYLTAGVFHALRIVGNTAVSSARHHSFFENSLSHGNHMIRVRGHRVEVLRLKFQRNEHHDSRSLDKVSLGIA